MFGAREEMPSGLTPSEQALYEEDLGPKLITICWVFFITATVVIITRYYVRIRILSRMGIDDWLILLTYLLALGNSVFCTIAVYYGVGRHIQFVEAASQPNAIKYIYLCQFFAIMSPGIGRISYAFLLLEIVPPQKWRKQYLWTIIIVQFVIDVGTVIISFAQCQPIQEYWEKPPGVARCWDPRVQLYTGYFQGSVCSFVDLLLAIFPASLFWNLKMKLDAKLSLSMLMGLGVFGMVCSIMKTIQIRNLAEKADPTYSMAGLAVWWTHEAYVVLIAVSIPTLRPLAHKNHVPKPTTYASSADRSYNLSNIRRGDKKLDLETADNFAPLPGTAHSNRREMKRRSDGASDRSGSSIEIWSVGPEQGEAEAGMAGIERRTSIDVKYERAPGTAKTEGSIERSSVRAWGPGPGGSGELGQAR